MINHFSAYGESAFLAIQTITIALLVLLFDRQSTAGLVYLLLYGAAMTYLLSGVAPMNILAGLQASVMPITAMAKVYIGYCNVLVNFQTFRKNCLVLNKKCIIFFFNYNRIDLQFL